MINVDSIADLKSITAPYPDVVNVLGYYTKGDGGDGLFYWDNNSTDVQNEGTIFIPNSSPATGRWIRNYTGSVNVKWFGAKGNNATDDTRAFEYAIKYLKSTITPSTLKPECLFVPRGEYYVTQIVYTFDGFNMIGESSSSTVFKFLNEMHNVEAGILSDTNVTNPDLPDFKFYTNIKIENISCDPSTIPREKSFILLRNCYNVVVRDIYVDNESFLETPKFALDIQLNVYCVLVENCHLPKVKCEGRLADNKLPTSLTTITFINLKTTAIRLINSYCITFLQPIIQGSEVAKIYVNNCHTVSILSGDMEDKEGTQGSYLRFDGKNNNIRSLGNDISAIKGLYIDGEIPENSLFNDQGFDGIGDANLNGKYGRQLIMINKENSIGQSILSEGGYVYNIFGNKDGGINAKFSYQGFASAKHFFGKINDDLQTKTEYMNINDTGNLLIGYPSNNDTGQKIQVNGTIKLNPFITTSALGGIANTLPANPVGYITVNIDGIDRKIPYYQ